MRVRSDSTSQISYLLARDRARCGLPEGSGDLIVVPNRGLAEIMLSDMEFFHGEGVLEYPAWEVLPFENLSPAPEVSGQRLSTLVSAPSAKVIVASVSALMQRVITPARLASLCFELRKAMVLRREQLILLLETLGFSRASLVEEVGQYAVRGSVVDFSSPSGSDPIRIEFFDDELESIRTFDSSSQRSTGNLEVVTLLPIRELSFSEISSDLKVSVSESSKIRAIGRLRARAKELDISSRRIRDLEESISSGEALIEHYLPFVEEKLLTFWDHLPEDFHVTVFDEDAVQVASEEFEALVEERASRLTAEDKLFPDGLYCSADEFVSSLSKRDPLIVETLQLKRKVQNSFELRTKGNEKLSSSLIKSRGEELPLKPLADFISKAQPLAIVTSSPQRAERVQDLLRAYEISTEILASSFNSWEPREKVVDVLCGHLSAGFSTDKFCLIAEQDVFPDVKVRRRQARSGKSVRRFLGEVSQLKENDYIVHIDHGVGFYRGLKAMDVGGMKGEFLVLEYAEAAKLILPIENIGKLQKYIGAEGKNPPLNKLGGAAWAKTKRKVKKQVAELAGELINLYAARQLAEGYSFGKIDSDDRYFAETFEFEETPDQSDAIEAVLKDMSNSQPMDRLVCGDVGYGKTEVAIRAAFKAANAGKQVALLVPTTVLSAQHLATFEERFANLPFKVAGLNRFFSTEENKQTLSKLASGKVDIAIGTHRLLSRDVEFRDLGLVIVDEEHRFGVAHKEKLKQLKKSVDVLTLTATPIPRTLHMSLLGIRDLSVIETAPADRQVIRTYLAEYEDSLVREAILREIGRSGQVFYIHNRVQNIALIADELAELVPEARIEFAHGQMKERELEAVMHRFVKGEFDVLVSTTIVESGLDIANANTIIIRKAEHFGLAELYQLRGRVGRSSKRAYAYLLVSDPKRLGEDAKKRLKVLQSLDDLGMGFRLALQDMEIRGAGNLLGKDQSGQVNLVGYEMFTRILKEAIRELRNEESLPQFDPEISIGFPLFIPDYYVPDVAERLLLYRRFVSLTNEAAARDFAEEIEDRFGHPPKEVQWLYENTILRSLLRRRGVASLRLSGTELRFAFHPLAKVDAVKLASLVSSSEGKLRLTPGMAVIADVGQLTVESPTDLRKHVQELLDLMEIGTLDLRIVDLSSRGDML